VSELEGTSRAGYGQTHNANGREDIGYYPDNGRPRTLVWNRQRLLQLLWLFQCRSLHIVVDPAHVGALPMGNAPVCRRRTRRVLLILGRGIRLSRRGAGAWRMSCCRRLRHCCWKENQRHPASSKRVLTQGLRQAVPQGYTVYNGTSNLWRKVYRGCR
jgi:hypothetical protein